MSTINNISINGFKSIGDVSLMDCRRINVLIGPPNSGKSNILEAMSLLAFSNSNIWLPPELSDLVRVQDSIDLFHNWDIDKPFTLDCNDSLHIDGSFDENKLLTLTVTGYDGDVGYNVGSLIFSRNLTDRSSSGFDNNTYQLGQLVKFYKYKAIDEIANADQSSSLQFPNGDNIDDVIIGNKTLRSWMKGMFEAYGVQLVVEKNTHSIKFQRMLPDGTAILYPYYLTADTLKRLAFYMAAMHSNHNTVLLFEEPEAHCFEPYILEFTNALKLNVNDNQYFVVTHSDYVVHELLRDSDTRQDVAIYLVKSDNHETSVKRLSDEAALEGYASGLNFFFNFDLFWNEMQPA